MLPGDAGDESQVHVHVPIGALPAVHGAVHIGNGVVEQRDHDKEVQGEQKEQDGIIREPFFDAGHKASPGGQYLSSYGKIRRRREREHRNQGEYVGGDGEIKKKRVNHRQPLEGKAPQNASHQKNKAVLYAGQIFLFKKNKRQEDSQYLK